MKKTRVYDVNVPVYKYVGVRRDSFVTLKEREKEK